MTYKVQILDYDALTEEEISKVYAEEDDYAEYIKVTYKGKTILLDSDCMEPEDATFSRDLGWIEDALKDAYKLGVADGKKLKTK